MRRIKLIAVDLDGTILNRSGEITQRTYNALELASAAGCTIVIFTGRAVSMVPKSIKESPIIGYLSTSNGACLRRTKDDCILHHVFLDKKVAQGVSSVARAGNAAIKLFFENYAVFDIRNYPYILAGAKHLSRNGLKRLCETRKNIRFVFSAEYELRHSLASLEKIGCNFRTNIACEQVLCTLRENKNINAVRVQENELEITSFGVSKGMSLGVLCSMLHIDASEVVAFGDSGNDLSMKEYAGCFVAMGNATPEVKAAADYITDAVNEDGVVKWLEQYLEV